MEIRGIYGNVICHDPDKTLRELAEDNRDRLQRAKLHKAELTGADLAGSNFCEANLEAANLAGADLKRADFTEANLWGAILTETNFEAAILKVALLGKANLERANFERAYLGGAYLVGADLRKSNFEGADLREAYLVEANLIGAKLDGANIEFRKFPSIRFLLSLDLRSLSNKLTLELMRRDAYAHPQPEKFDEWAEAEDRPCPYNDVERFWYFEPKRELWESGPPQMTDRDLIVAICEEKGWKIV